MRSHQSKTNTLEGNDVPKCERIHTYTNIHFLLQEAHPSSQNQEVSCFNLLIQFNLSFIYFASNLFKG